MYDVFGRTPAVGQATTGSEYIMMLVVEFLNFPDLVHSLFTFYSFKFLLQNCNFGDEQSRENSPFG